MNVQPHGWEVYGQEFKDLKSCREAALEINEKMDNANAEANRLNILQIEQIYAWCEKN